MIDRGARARAADLIRYFRDGRLTNDELVEKWPSRSSDRVIEAMNNMLWNYYDDLKEHALTGKYALLDDGRANLTRYAQFLDSDLPYEWPQVRFDRVGTPAWPFVVIGAILTLGLVLPVYFWHRRRIGEFEADLRRTGEFDLWPFIRKCDFDAMNSAEIS